MRAAIPSAACIIALTGAGATLARPAGVDPLVGAVAGLLVAAATVAAILAARRVPTGRLVGALAGGLGGLLAAALLRTVLVPGLDAPQPLAGALAAVGLAAAGAWLGAERGGRLALLGRLVSDAPHAAAPADAPAARAESAARAAATKIVDTSVIIDGRIADIVEAGFIEGGVVIPQFVLKELQQVADSSDPLKRNRGRKGLDILRTLQGSDRVRVEFTNEDNPEIREVDGKLLWLAQRRGARILTNDYNLNKIAQLHGIPVLNVNDLANAVRPVVLPGEPLMVQVIKEGKERNQGVGYLDDGTMVVVENGKRLLGQKLDVLVTSVIQTNAGKMIFAATEEDDVPEVRPRVLRRVPDRDLREASAPSRVAPTVTDN